jgi:hypothetical protein
MPQPMRLLGLAFFPDMNAGEKFSSEELEVIGAAELKAMTLGHDLGFWHRIDDHIIVSVCYNCHYVSFVARPHGDSWRIGHVVEAGQCRARG